jgi:hypothetical protein
LRLLKVAVAISTLFATTVALAQTVTPQGSPSQVPPIAQPAAGTAAQPDTQRAATGGQTQGSQGQVIGFEGAGGLGTGATLAIVAGVILIGVAAASGGGSSSTQHQP